MIQFILPNLYENMKLNEIMAILLKQNPEYFRYKDLFFTYCEGTFPYFYWSNTNYNNISNAYILKREDLIPYCYGHNKFLLNCANDLLTPQDLYDVKTNVILESLNNGSNAILVSHPLMINFLSENYGNYYLIGDANYYCNDPNQEYLNQLKYIKQNSYNLNNAWYNNIPKSKIFYEISTFCNGCPSYLDCQNKDKINRLMFSEYSTFQRCTKTHFKLLSHQEILDLIQKGYQNFYINTEGFNPYDVKTFINLYLTLFINPEYYDTVLKIIEKELYQ